MSVKTTRLVAPGLARSPLIAAGCTRGSAAPGVAVLGSTSTTTTATTTSHAKKLSDDTDPLASPGRVSTHTMAVWPYPLSDCTFGVNSAKHLPRRASHHFVSVIRTCEHPSADNDQTRPSGLQQTLAQAVSSPALVARLSTRPLNAVPRPMPARNSGLGKQSPALPVGSARAARRDEDIDLQDAITHLSFLEAVDAT